MWVLGQVPAVALLIQLPANVMEKAEDEDPSAWAPAMHVGDLDEVSGSWTRPDQP